MNGWRVLNGQPRKVRFMLGCESLCHLENVGIYPTCNMELYVFTQESDVIRDAFKRETSCNKNGLRWGTIEPW